MAIVTTRCDRGALRGRAVDRATEGGVAVDVRGDVRGGRALTVATVAVAMLALGALSGCGGGSSTSGSVPQTPTSTAPGTATPGATTPGATTPGTTAAARPGAVPVPDDDERKQLVVILEAVNPGVSTDEAALVRTAIGICGHILGGDPAATISAETRRGFTHGAYTPSPAEIQAMDAAITATFCR